MTAPVQTLAPKTDKFQTQMPTAQTKARLTATWVVENNRLVCKWLQINPYVR
ncbi:hypothetical protein SPB21_34200 [Leptothoe sp. ISB3NOV94-8A]|uniref:hypothetical protein n=1 Tax=Adonisia turfae TaxID=2950184 RepID=UPI0013D5777F|nr:hypothetical protein [Adonisia turfae]MDV3348616.1 hypothetical protein [Leptothoe sp. LEGE 181152]